MRESWFSEAAAPRWLLLGCLLGLLLRVGFFLPERALWLDEALTALNLAEREASGLLEPLDGDQAAPPAFLLASKLSGEAGQGSAHALRFPALLASLLALLAFAAWARASLPGPAAAAAVWLFALMPGLIQFGAELKPYAFDALSCVLILALAQRVMERPNVGRIGALAALGLLVPWFSFASVFVLAGVGPALAWSLVREQKLSLALPLGVAAAWLSSFLLLWQLAAADSASNEAFAHYWQNAFLPLPPTEARDLGLLARAPFDLLLAPFQTRYAHPSGDFAPYLAALLALLVGLGLRALWRERSAQLGMLLGPLLAAALASALGFYPFIGRFLLVFAPLVAWGAARGWIELRQGSRGTAGLLLGLSLLATAPLFLRPTPAVQTRQALLALQDHIQPGDTLLVHSRSLASFLYYSQHDPACALPKGVRLIEGAMAGEGLSGLLRQASELELTGQVWFLFEQDWDAPHPTGVLGAPLEQRAPRVASLYFEGTQLHRLDFSPGQGAGAQD